jgi:hypothetical protein
MPILAMLVDEVGKSRPATTADRRLLRRKLATRAGAPIEVSRPGSIRHR